MKFFFGDTLDGGKRKKIDFCDAHVAEWTNFASYNRMYNNKCRLS
jgi:hypothetical protein